MLCVHSVGSVKKGNRLVAIRLMDSEKQYSGRRVIAFSGLCVVVMDFKQKLTFICNNNNNNNNNNNIFNCKWAVTWWRWLLCMYMNKLRGLSPRANYTDRAAAASWRS